MKDVRQKRLFTNTFFLYILTFSNQILGLLLIPYLTRILGPTVYGQLGVALSIMSYVQIILDFGFILSATEQISKYRENQSKCIDIISTVTYTKLGLSITLLIIFAVICKLVPSFNSKFELYCVFYIAYAINAFLPDFFYRGIEKMKIITIRTVAIKSLFTILVFVFVKEEGDLFYYPILLCMGNLLAVFGSYLHIKRKYGMHIRLVNFIEIKHMCEKTIPFFLSRIFATFYQSLTTILLGMLYSNQPVVGYYTASDKLMTLAKTSSSPVADSLYPYMTKNKDYRLIKQILKITIPIICIGAIIVFLFADYLCVFIFGDEYAEAAGLMRCMIPAMAVIFPTYIICFPLLVPMGLEKQANYSNIIGGVLQIVFLSILFATGNANVYSICICGTISEIAVFAYRAGIAYRYRTRMA